MATLPLEIESIVANDLCIGCGACVEVCPASAIEPRRDAGRGAWEVAVADHAACPTCEEPCASVCPSIAVPLVELAASRGMALADNEASEPRFGSIRRVATGHAPRFRADARSSSGGVLREIVASSLEAGRSVVCLAERADGRLGADLVESIDELDRVPGSIYHSVGFDGALDRVRAAPGEVVLVSIPCHLEGLARVLQDEPALAEKIVLTAGLVCGWMYTDHAIRAFASYKGLGEKGHGELELDRSRYRGGGEEVGKLRLTVDGREYDHDRRRFATPDEALDYQASFTGAANRLRCRVCQDHLNVLADVVVGDAWLSRLRGVKSSIVLVRSERGERVIEELERSGRVELADGSIDDVVESQSESLCLGTAAREIAWLMNHEGVAPTHFDYGDGRPVATKPRVRDRAILRGEWRLRALLRAGRYDDFRSAYARWRDFRRWLRAPEALLRRARRAIGGG